MNEKANINLTGRDAAKLLEGLTKDPQLRSEDDPSILVEEQFPTDHHALLQGKTDGSSTDNIIHHLAMGEAPHSSSVANKSLLTSVFASSVSASLIALKNMFVTLCLQKLNCISSHGLLVVAVN